MRSLAFLLLIVPALCQAQDAFPSRTVRIIVPYPAATPPDVLARIAAQRLNESWGQPVIVEVRDGAAGAIGTTQVARAAPDGYTLLFTPDFPIVMQPALGETQYDAGSKAGLESIWLDGPQFRKTIQNDLAKWSRLARDMKLRGPQ